MNPSSPRKCQIADGRRSQDKCAHEPRRGGLSAAGQLGGWQKEGSCCRTFPSQGDQPVAQWAMGGSSGAYSPQQVYLGGIVVAIFEAQHDIVLYHVLV